ncbi:hypothetical protein [Orrella daihaiensis]|uniref:DUF4276 family protein n=1 Tax=Orrella daihaiensis TaxID=2782176 RepID=A0ABY4AME3_9BURK|nr:hypothetical protein [Orrella daihaiensis]UOD51448.1 hypothetical protein DHf2319_06385 [Orrella daihaiensis]
MRKSVRKTVLLCCEGKADQAFVAYLRSTYTAGKRGAPYVLPKQAGGKGGNHVIATLLGELRCSKPDRAVALLDADCPPAAAKRREARHHGIELIALEPCLEGLLLRILGLAVPPSSQACKERLKSIDRRDPFDPGFYAKHFPKARLDIERQSIPELDSLLALFDS